MTRTAPDRSVGIKYQAELLRTTDGKAKADGSSIARLTFSNAKRTVTLDGKEELRVREAPADARPDGQSSDHRVRHLQSEDLAELKPVLTAIPAKATAPSWAT